MQAQDQMLGQTGLPELPGLRAGMNPMAEALQSKGRGNDTMLVHMTPEEVNSLQGLAMATGGSLTINPDTGLPEAGWLGDLLPTIIGGLGMLIPGMQPWMMALGGLGVGTAASGGDILKGLQIGLGAFGGASLAGGLGAGEVFGKTAGAAAEAGKAGALMGADLPAGSLASNAMANIPGQAAASVASLPGPASGGILSNFGNAAKAGLPGGILQKAAPMAAGMGLLNTASEVMTPEIAAAKGDENKSNYAGPYKYAPRPATFYPTEDILGSSKEKLYFANSQPALLDAKGNVAYPGSGQSGPVTAAPAPTTPVKPPSRSWWAAAKPLPINGQEEEELRRSGVGDFRRGMNTNMYKGGGEVELKDGSFIVDARTVSELGNGSSNAGMEMLAKLGGKPLHGPGDGVSDSIPAKIGGKQEARVARDEVYMPPEAVKQAGGAKKLYALMDKAHKARKSAKRGQDTGLARGLGAL